MMLQHSVSHGMQLSILLASGNECCMPLTFLQRVRIARKADRYVLAKPFPSVCPSFRHVPVLCQDE